MLVPEYDGMVLISPFPINRMLLSVNYGNLRSTPKPVFSALTVVRVSSLNHSSLVRFASIFDTSRYNSSNISVFKFATIKFVLFRNFRVRQNGLMFHRFWSAQYQRFKNLTRLLDQTEFRFQEISTNFFDFLSFCGQYFFNSTRIKRKYIQYFFIV